MSRNGFGKRPLIGCTTFRQTVEKPDYTIDMVGLTPTYIRAIEKAGGIPILIPCGLPQDDIVQIFNQLDGVLLPGGGDIDPVIYGGQMHETVYGISPERDDTELFLARHAVANDKPLFAICRGVQVLNVALGGTLWEDVKLLMPNGTRHAYHGEFPRNHLAHTVDVDPNSQLSHFLGIGSVGINSLHHQGIKKLAPVLVGTAVSPDGLIEAVEAPAHPFALGVQWHPENLVDDSPAMLALFEGLVEAAAIASQPQLA